MRNPVVVEEMIPAVSPNPLEMPMRKLAYLGATSRVLMMNPESQKLLVPGMSISKTIVARWLEVTKGRATAQSDGRRSPRDEKSFRTVIKLRRFLDRRKSAI